MLKRVFVLWNKLRKMGRDCFFVGGDGLAGIAMCVHVNCYEREGLVVV